MILVFSTIADMKNIRQILDHKLAKTKLTMIVIPIGVLLATAIVTTDQGDTLQISLLSSQPPIGVLCHKRRNDA